VTFPEGFTLAQIAARLDRDMPTMTAADVMAAAADPSLVANLRPPDVTTLEGLLFPDTYQVSTARPRPRARPDGRPDGAGRRQENIETKAPKFGMSPYQILTIASMIEREAKTDADRPKIGAGHLQPPRQGDAARHRRRRSLRHRAVGCRSGQHPVQPAARHPGAVQHVPEPGPAADADRQPRPGVDPRRLNPAANPSVGDPLCANLPQGVACEYLYYVIADEDGNHAFAVTPEQHQANVDAAAAAGLL
jgi:UPF0755 protein